MKKRFSEEQITGFLREADAGVARSTPSPVPPPGEGKLKLETLWFTYDGLKWVVIHQGVLNNGSIGLVEPEYWSSRQSHQNVYDSAGRLVVQAALATKLDHSQPGPRRG